MARVVNQNIPPEYQELWNKNMVTRGTFAGVRADKKFIVQRTRNFVSLIARSPFQSIANLWNSLSGAWQTDWDDAGYWAGMSGWDLFVLDTNYRRENSFPGLATPSLFHQFFVGKLYIPDFVEHVKIRQVYNDLDDDYIGFWLNWKHQLISTGGGSYAKMRSTTKTGYWLEDIDDWEIVIDEINLLYSGDWQFEETNNSESMIPGDNQVIIDIDIYKMTGILYFDGSSMEVDSGNVVNDPQCNEVETSWEKNIFPAGVTLESVYPPDNI